MRISDHIREVSPGFDATSASIIDDVLHDNTGKVSISTTEGVELGTVNLAGQKPATIVVSFAGVSRGSGGELYEPVLVQTDKEEHYIISTLPDTSLFFVD